MNDPQLVAELTWDEETDLILAEEHEVAEDSDAQESIELATAAADHAAELDAMERAAEDEADFNEWRSRVFG